MFWFSVHFGVLPNSGDGDGFMSSQFQSTLAGHQMEDTPADVAYGSKVYIRHLETSGGYLHSHPHNYPGGSNRELIFLMVMPHCQLSMLKFW
jgi:dolichyl-phosphate-mannose-protein mannosyltransferase